MKEHLLTAQWFIEPSTYCVVDGTATNDFCIDRELNSNSIEKIENDARSNFDLLKFLSVTCLDRDM